VVEGGKTGLLVRPADPEAIAEPVVTMMQTYDFRQRAAKLRRTKVENKFDVAKEGAKLNDCS
jgi:hypothetical protein